jgi:hypothetical protein
MGGGGGGTGRRGDEQCETADDGRDDEAGQAGNGCSSGFGPKAVPTDVEPPVVVGRAGQTALGIPTG